MVEHHKLGETVAGFDCLLMPFVISEIVLYVDPVKLYEYIAWGKCIIASWYPEIDRFSDFVYFYHDSGEYVELIKIWRKRDFHRNIPDSSRESFFCRIHGRNGSGRLQSC